MDFEKNDETDKGKKYTHCGVPMMLFLLLFYTISIVFMVIFWANELFYILLPTTVFFLFGILNTYNITITVNNTYFSFKLGVGLIKKRYKIVNIKSCKPYSGISKRIGIGSKLSITGNVLNYYIVTGFKSIEIQFHDRKTVVHIGTPLPEEISQYIQLLIDGNKNIQ